jgi:hypothetical protein
MVALRTRILPLRTCADTQKPTFDGMPTVVEHALTHTATEGLTREIGIAKNLVHGYRTVAAFPDINYLVVGDFVSAACSAHSTTTLMSPQPPELPSHSCRPSCANRADDPHSRGACAHALIRNERSRLHRP